jgi:hypothetical protein
LEENDLASRSLQPEPQLTTTPIEVDWPSQNFGPGTHLLFRFLVPNPGTENDWSAAFVTNIHLSPQRFFIATDVDAGRVLGYASGVNRAALALARLLSQVALSLDVSWPELFVAAPA